MANNRDPEQNQNISEVLEMLRQSYSSNDSGDSVPGMSDPNFPEHISEEDLKEKLRKQYASGSPSEKESYSDTDAEAYNIDESFLNTDAESADDESDLPKDSEEPEEIEEIEGSEELSERDLLEELDEEDDEPLTEEEIEMLKRLSEDEESDADHVVFGELEQNSEETNEDDMTFDELPDCEDDGIIFQPLPLEEFKDGSDSGDVTFVQLSDDDDGDTAYTPIEPEGSELQENSVFDVMSKIESEAEKEELSGATDTESNPPANAPSDDIEAVLDEMVVEDGVRPKYQVSSSDLSILLQLGCDEEIFEIVSDEDIEKITITDSLSAIPEEYNSETIDDVGKECINEADKTHKEPREVLEDKILSVYDGYHKARGGMFLRLLITSVMCGVLFLYEALPLLNVRLPGIMDRKEYFFSYVLIGLQLLVICCLPSVKQLYEGAKHLFTKRADIYSMVDLILVTMIVYDIVIVSVKPETPHVFHFLLSLLIVSAVASECASLTFEMKMYKYFFGDMIDRASGETIIGSEKRESDFTLQRSSGKNSTAEKMYCGGLDPSSAVYYPLAVDSTAGYFHAMERRSRRSLSPTVMILPSLILSVIAGILVLLIPNIDGVVWTCFNVSLTSLFLTLPLITVVSSWLPFGIFNDRNIKEGFAFAGEQSAEIYSDCNVFVFKDMHVFEKCSSKNVNLAIYDATGNDVIISCLDAVYSKIGGPLESVFSMGDGAENPLGECRLRRIAKSGVEAMVGSNYSVLVGNEQFMARYGIPFPNVNFKNGGDEIYSLCVSINGRASARIIAKYTVNEIFEMFATRLEEDGIYCAVETFDPMINAESLGRLRNEKYPPVSVVHLGIDDYHSGERNRKEGVLFDIDDESMGVLAKKSRLNLVVAASNAKRMRRLRTRVNLLCYALSILGLGICCLDLIFNWIEGMNEFYILLYWILSAGALAAVIFTGLPKRDRFSIEKYQHEQGLKD